MISPQVSRRERRDELRALRAGAAPDETVDVVGVEVENSGKGLLEMEGSDCGLHNASRPAEGYNSADR